MTTKFSNEFLCFAYKTPESNDLQQGDILNKTPEIEKILSEVHPHYLKEDYKYFLVLSQTCDLVRRNGVVCKARYLTLAAVRPLELVLERKLEEYQSKLEKFAKVCSDKKKEKISQFVERLLDNNESEYFYLHEESSAGFPESLVAFLRLSISLRANEHYSKCTEARVLSLTDVFQAKLGWLTGNMYSRVGTEDWVPKYKTANEFKQHINEILESVCSWVDDKKLAQAKKATPDDLYNRSYSEIRGYIESFKGKKNRGLILDSIIDELKELNLIDEKSSGKVRQRISNNPIFKQYTNG